MKGAGMNIVFVSNYMNVHQISFCEAMDKILREGGVVSTSLR